ncbi:MAG: RNA-binding transcriptional accessory protein, partial [Spirochaetaceae bacterium]|nr:RNA-binding transcriptional accessory protein [Spirochaetaceae bacterium]
EFIEALALDERAIVERAASRLDIKQDQVQAAAELLAGGSTVPFIARYRKEKTGSLDEVQVRDIEHLLASLKNLETRRMEIIRGIYAQGKLTEALYGNITGAATLTELEDMYAPYKRKKKTRGMIAAEKGLEGLAGAMKELEEAALLARAADYITGAEDTPPELVVASLQDALQGAMDIIAEETAQDTGNRSEIKAFYVSDGNILVKGKGGDEAKKTSTYQMYWDYKEALSQIRPHRILAVNRGEREGVLEVTIDTDEETAVRMLWNKYVIHNDYHKTAIEDGLKRLLSPAVIRELRGDQSDSADDHGISVFSENLKNLLLQRPIKGTRVLGIDPGIRTGTKCACLDDTGKHLGNFVIYNHKQEEAKKLLLEAVRNYQIELIAVGNGTGTREVQELVSQLISENNLETLYTVVDEDGASVYSASDIAREEFPGLDLTIRGAISIGRRLQDPLSELVKIDPRSIGVGLYQHDVNQKKLSESLDEVVSSVVNNVGVNLNTASVSLLKYVSGINASLARKIVGYREEKGRISSRDELTSVPGMGPKSYEQCAGFLKIPESSDPLDNTWVHPENYAAARKIQEYLTPGNTITTSGGPAQGPGGELFARLKEEHGIGDTTIRDIVEELKKPNRDPRDDYPRPILQKGIVSFEDLSEGMTITGKIKNVVDFGAFVDLGIKETALVHISELSDQYVKDPMNLVKVGDVCEFRIIALDRDRKRISLSRKKEAAAPVKETAKAAQGPAPEKRRPVPVAVAAGKESRPGGQRPAAAGPVRQGPPGKAPPAGKAQTDDGTMYNPFADAFKKMKERNGQA